MKAKSSDVPLRHAIASAWALVICFIGVVHEVVGSTLYPNGPAEFGGPLFWHLAGLALVVFGVLLFLGTLGFLRFPVRPVALAVCVAGLAIAGQEALQNHHFHLFAATLGLAGAAVFGLYRPERE